ncbi:MAG: DUF4433 domain-containing protein [bacterium]|nr:DUF4433 domain-containing protein [bacterium]
MPTQIYHITHIGNLESIIKASRLYSDAAASACNPRSIAYLDLKRKRKEKTVPVPPNGCVADYVPFYFAPRSPMLYAIHKGCVRSGLSQTEIIYLVTSVETIVRAGKPFVFTDCHPLSYCRFSNNLQDLNQFVDWQVMRSEYWHDNPQHPNRKSRRQAEFLVHQAVEWSLIERIGVYDQGRLQQVQQILQSASHRPLVSVRRDWYY